MQIKYLFSTYKFGPKIITRVSSLLNVKPNLMNEEI